MTDGIGAQRVDFVAILVKDRAQAIEFYEGVLGLERNPSSNEGFPEYEVGNVTLSLVSPEEVGMDFTPTPPGQIALRVPDVAAARATLEGAGVGFPAETYDSGVCHMAWFTDPFGNGLMLHHRYAPYRDGRSPDEQV